jgi:hypothetical protein
MRFALPEIPDNVVRLKVLSGHAHGAILHRNGNGWQYDNGRHLITYTLAEVFDNFGPVESVALDPYAEAVDYFKANGTAGIGTYKAAQKHARVIIDKLLEL